MASPMSKKETDKGDTCATNSNLSNTSSSNNSLLSPVTSPAPQVKQHGPGNLTGHLRKVKDLAADLHNLTKKWESLKAQGMNIITEMANILMTKIFNTQSDDSGSSPKVLPPELQPLCDSLTEIVELMENLVLKMHHKVTLSEGLISLQNFQRSKPNSNVLFMTMTLEDVAQTVKAIEGDYRKELEMKREITKVIVHADGRDAVMFYLASWMHEPYIHEENADQLKALLKDTGHIK